MSDGPRGEEPAISIVVPVLNDAAALGSLLRDCRALFGDVEVIVSDGGSDDEPDAVCRRHGARLVRGAPGRGPQLNRGAAAASGDVLWFVHADSTLHGDSLGAIRGALRRSGAAGGAFRFSLAAPHWYKPLLDLAVNLRSRLLAMPYGDQAFFVRREAFEAMGGFPNVAILEDADFFRRLKRHGGGILLPQPVGVSARQWEADGFLRATARNLFVLAAGRLGVPPERLARWSAPPRHGRPGRADSRAR